MGCEHNPLTIIEDKRDSPKVNVFCAISKTKVYGPFFFNENTVNGRSYLEMLQTWLFLQLNNDSDNQIFQQDGAPPHWHLDVRSFLTVGLVAPNCLPDFPSLFFFYRLHKILCNVCDYFEKIFLKKFFFQ